MQTRYQKVFLIGIGGIGMSALARYFLQQGSEVAGYDRHASALTYQLQQEGIQIFFENPAEGYPAEVDLVIYTPAIPEHHPALKFYKEGNYLVKKRSEVLGEITEGEFLIAVAGSHGKTTVSTMIAHILMHNGYNCTAFLGGISANYKSNYLCQQGSTKSLKHIGNRNIFVAEADEFDRSFHRLRPRFAVITSVDTDHLDVYGSKEAIDEAFITFAKNIYDEGFLAIKAQQSIQDRLPQDIDKVFYAFQSPEADVFCSKYWVVEGGYLFHIHYFGKEYKSFRLPVGGGHNIENAIAAFCICKELGLNNEEIHTGLASFKGIKRRFEKIIENDQHVLVDDYAHHPEEIRMFLKSLRELYSGRKITAVFQPHLFTRTRDLAEGFAESLRLADEVVILDIYPARELPIEGVTSALIYDRLEHSNKHQVTKQELVNFLRQRQIEVLATIGAGDIDSCLEEIASMLQ
jgi:UDP-N-acetylmuramate--alanine ligase